MNECDEQAGLNMTPPGSDKMTKFVSAHAVVIAVANYAEVNVLPEAVLNDGRDVAGILSAADRCGYPPSHVTTLLDGDATLSAIRGALASVAAVSGPDDSVFLFFSGHGARFGGTGGVTSALLPVDCRYNDLPGSTLSESEFSTALSAIQAKRLVVVIDACHSGGAGSLKQVGFPELEEGVDEKMLQRLAQGIGRVIIASSRASETSLVMQGSRNSVFTERLLEALQGHAQTHGDGLIRVFEVFNYVSQKVGETVPGRQHPIFKANDLEDNFPIALYKGGAKALDGPGSAAAQMHVRQVEDVMADLYPAGPVDEEIWARAGGDVSRLRLGGSGRAMWFSALKTLEKGGGGQRISTQSLLQTALRDYPHHSELKALQVAAQR